MLIHTHLLLNLYDVTASANIKLLCGSHISSSDFISQISHPAGAIGFFGELL